MVTCGSGSTPTNQDSEITFIQHENTNSCSRPEDFADRKRVFSVLKGFARQRDVMSIMTSSFLFAYISFTLDLLIPIIVFNVFKWSGEPLNIAYAVHSGVYFFSMLLLSKFCTTNKRVYWVTLISIIFIIICLCLTILMRSITLTETNKIILIVIFQIAYTPVWFLDEITYSNMLTRIVQTDIQGFTESLRSGCSRVSYIMASLIIALEFDVKYWAYLMMALSLLSFIISLIRHKRMTNLKNIKF